MPNPDYTALFAEVARDTTITDGVVTFLEGLPDGTTVAEAITALKANNDRAEAALASHVTLPS